MKKEREEYLEIIKELGGDPEGKRAAQEYIDHSDGYCYGIMAPISFVPAFYTADDLSFFKKLCETTHRILSKVIAKYVEDPEYRKLFSFPPEVEHLILLPCGYDEMLPISRFDFFLNEDDLSFKFCEFNADGAAAMSRTDLGCEAVMLSESFRRFARRHTVSRFELYESWVEEMMATYKSDRNAVSSPNVLLTDFEDAVIQSDITRFLADFRKKGIPARFVDVRKLKFDGKHLTDPSDGMVFHAVYRRLVTSDIAARPEECRALIDAVAAEKVSLIGHFRTTVVHSKTINIALLNEQTKAILTPEEWEFVKMHVLPSYRLQTGAGNPDLIAAVKSDKDRWIIKPEDNYDAKGVFAGIDHTEEEWTDLVDRFTDRHYLAMEFVSPPYAETYPLRPLPYTPDLLIPEKWHSMIGTFAYNGHFHGFFSRMGKEGVITESHGGVSVPSFAVDL